MKTAESLLKDEIGKLLVDLALSKVNHWARQELNYLRHALDYPVCINLNESHWVIGNFNIKHLGEHRYRVTANGKEVHTFYSKRAAIFYSVLTKIQHYNSADKLLQDDTRVAKLYDDLGFFAAKLAPSVKKDSFKLQLWQTRYIETKTQYTLARQELEKRINSAKYMKIWEKIL